MVLTISLTAAIVTTAPQIFPKFLNIASKRLDTVVKASVTLAMKAAMVGESGRRSEVDAESVQLRVSNRR